MIIIIIYLALVSFFSLSACLILRRAKCGFCCRSEPCFVMEMFFCFLVFFYFAHINFAHLICSLYDRAHFFGNETTLLELKSDLMQGELCELQE